MLPPPPRPPRPPPRPPGVHRLPRPPASAAAARGRARRDRRVDRLWDCSGAMARFASMIGGSPPVSLLPGGAAVGGFENAAIGAAERAVFRESLLLLPQRGVDGVGVARIDAHVVAAGVFVLIKNLLEAVRRRWWSGRCRVRDWGRRDGPAPRRRGGSALVGSTSMSAIICESRRPRCVQVLPASVDL